MSKSVNTTIVIPTYNEAESILGTIEEIFRHAPEDVRLLVVDDQSPDGTADIVLNTFSTHPRVAVIKRENARSFAQSYIEGFRRALDDPSTEAVFEMDADLSHHPRYLPALIDALNEHDVVIGSRYVPGGDIANFSRHRKLISRAANIYARALTRLPIRDITAGFIGYRRPILEAIPFHAIQSDGYGFQIEMKYHAHNAGARFKEIPIVFRDRYNGYSKFSKKMILEALRIGWRLR